MDIAVPDLPITLEDGRRLDVSSEKAKVLVLDFWGTWCAAGLAEMPAMQKLYAKYANDPKVNFYSVNPGWVSDSTNTREVITMQSIRTLWSSGVGL